MGARSRRCWGAQRAQPLDHPPFTATAPTSSSPTALPCPPASRPCPAQRGDVGAALPLYERALAIWEGVCGPDSPDVAHTLTDIAVIHLEQVGVLRAVQW